MARKKDSPIDILLDASLSLGRASRLRDAKPETVETFTYRGLTCEIVRFMEHVNGYVTGPIRVDSYDEADAVSDAHGGWTYFDDAPSDGHVKLGFDTAHYWDDASTQNPDYVREAIKEAVDSLYAAGVVDIDEHSTCAHCGATWAPTTINCPNCGSSQKDVTS